MFDTENKEPLKILEPEYKTLAKNALYSIVLNYSIYFFTLLNSFLLARMISREEWAILILATSLIGIFSIIVNFIPPGLILSMNFYIPRYRARNKQSKLRSFVIKAFYTRILISSVVFLIALISFSYFGGIFNVFLKNHIILLYILSPLIILLNLDTFFSTFLLGFNLFKTNLSFFILKSTVNILPLVFYLVLFKKIDIEIIALINLISITIPVLLEFLVFIFKIGKIKPKGDGDLKLKKFNKKVIKYGGFLRFESFINTIWIEVQTQAIGVLENKKWVTGNNIAKNYSNSNSLFLSSLTNPLIYSFSSLDYKKDFEKIQKMFEKIFSFSSFLFLFIAGILYFLSDFFLSIIYSETYVEYSTLIKLMQVSMVISMYPMLFGLLLRTTKKIKLLAIITSIFFPLHILFVFIGLMYYGIYGVYYAYIIINVLLFICDLILTWKLLEVKLKFFKIIIQYFSFFLAILLTIILGNLIFNELSYQIWFNLNLPIFKHFNLLNLLSFVIILLLLNILFNTFTKNDIEFLELLFIKDTTSHRYITKFLRLLKKLLR